ncbi:MAG: pilus assembly protein TadG-related protein, partial [Brevundimonas sp.]
MKHSATTSGLNRLMRATRAFAARFAAGTRGNVAMMFGLALPVLLMMTLGAIDIHQASKVRANLQDALDAAALAAARSNAADAKTITDVGMAALKANMPGYFIDGNGDTATFVLQNKVVVADAKVNVKVLVANIVLPPYGKLLDDYLPVSTQSQVDRSSRNVEVGLVLDITGSMDNCNRNCPPQSKMAALKVAAKQLVAIVVQEDQQYFYSRMAIIPYSTSVNMGAADKGGYVVGARGTPIGATAITGAAWTTGASKSITGITRANPA